MNSISYGMVYLYLRMLKPGFLPLKHTDLQLDSSMILLPRNKLVGNPLAPCNVIGSLVKRDPNCPNQPETCLNK
jgi:hypothetical protein